jgi:hypothetical protein
MRFPVQAVYRDRATVSVSHPEVPKMTIVILSTFVILAVGMAAVPFIVDMGGGSRRGSHGRHPPRSSLRS